MSWAYLTASQFRLKTLLPSNILDAIEARAPGWLDEQLSLVSSRLEAQLRKRYGRWAEPYPVILTEWVTHIVSLRALLKNGVRADDEQYSTFKELHDTALKEVNEAANSETGLYDLAAVDNTDATNISRGAPLAYSESSPYVAFDQQSETGRREDDCKGGTFR